MEETPRDHLTHQHIIKMAYDNRGKFVLFKNDKGGNPKRPDYRGRATTQDGVEYELSGWIKLDKNKEEFIGGEIKIKMEREERPRPVDNPAPARRQEEKGGDFSADDEPPPF